MVLSVLGLSRGAGESLYYYSSHSSLLSFAVSVPVYVHFTQGYFPEQANVSFYAIVDIYFIFRFLNGIEPCWLIKICKMYSCTSGSSDKTEILPKSCTSFSLLT